MMFPDTNNNQQLAALRRTTERYRAAGNSQVVYQHTMLKPFATMREGFNLGGAYQPKHFASAREELSLA